VLGEDLGRGAGAPSGGITSRLLEGVEQRSSVQVVEITGGVERCCHHAFQERKSFTRWKPHDLCEQLAMHVHGFRIAAG